MVEMADTAAADVDPLGERPAKQRALSGTATHGAAVPEPSQRCCTPDLLASRGPGQEKCRIWVRLRRQVIAAACICRRVDLSECHMKS